MAQDPNGEDLGVVSRTARDAAAESDADELDEGAVDETGDSGGEEEEWTPPTREQWQAQQDAHKAALEAERAKLARARKQAERLRKGGAQAVGGDGAAGEGGQQAAAGGEVDVWRGRAVRAAAKAGLLDRGADSETVSLMLGGLKTDRIEFDDSDEPELDDWLDEMEERYPKLFAKAAPVPAEPARPRAGRVEQGAPAGARPPVRPKPSLGQLIIDKSEMARRNGRRGLG